MLYTTLKLLREQQACSSGMSMLIASLDAKHSEDKQISLAHILKSNGLEHAIWALRATTVDARKVAARMSIEFALQVLCNFEKQFPEDKRPRTALERAADFLDGKTPLSELESAAESAESAAWSAAEWSAESARSAAESAESAESAAEWSAAEWSARSAAESARSAWSAESARSAAESAEWSARSAWSAAHVKIFKKWISRKP